MKKSKWWTRHNTYKTPPEAVEAVELTADDLLDLLAEDSDYNDLSVQHIADNIMFYKFGLEKELFVRAANASAAKRIFTAMGDF